MARNISLRPVVPQDDEFLLHLYRHTHGQTLARLGEDPQMQMLLKMQFSAQQQQYAAYKDAELQIVLSDGEPVGCWYVQRKPTEFQIIDVAILPEHQSGIGRALVRGFLEEAAVRNVAVRAHVLKANRAWFLWQRMGFRIVGDAGMHHEILWSR